LTEAKSELANNQALAGERDHIERMKLTETMKTMAKTGKFVVSGESGNKLMDFFGRAIEAIDKK
jgi:hypothetical protein